MKKDALYYFGVDDQINQRIAESNPILIKRLNHVGEALGIRIQINSAKRTQDEQTALQKGNNKYPVAPGNTSKHLTGDALDIDYKSVLKHSQFNGDMKKMKAFFNRFGLDIPYDNDPVHVEGLKGFKEADPFGYAATAALRKINTTDEERASVGPWTGMVDDPLMLDPNKIPTMAAERIADVHGTTNNFFHQVGDKTTAAALDSPLISGLRLVSNAIWADKPKDREFRQEHYDAVFEANLSPAGLNYVLGATNPDELMLRLRQKKEDDARIEKVSRMSMGLSSIGTVVGSVGPDILMMGGLAAPRTLFTSGLKKLGGSASKLALTKGAFWADKAAFAAINGGLAAVDRRLAEEMGGFEQNYKAAILSSAAFSLALGTLVDMRSRGFDKTDNPNIIRVFKKADEFETAVAREAMGYNDTIARTWTKMKHTADDPALVKRLVKEEMMEGFKESNVIIVNKKKFAELMGEKGVSKKHPKAMVITEEIDGIKQRMTVLNPESWQMDDTLESVLAHEVGIHQSLSRRLNDEGRMYIHEVVRRTVLDPDIPSDHLLKRAQAMSDGDDFEDVLGFAAEIIETSKGAQKKALIKEFDEVFKDTDLNYSSTRLGLKQMFNEHYYEILEDGSIKQDDVVFSALHPAAVLDDVAETLSTSDIDDLSYLSAAEHTDKAQTFTTRNDVVVKNNSRGKFTRMFQKSRLFGTISTITANSPSKTMKYMSEKLFRNPTAGVKGLCVETAKEKLLTILVPEMKKFDDMYLEAFKKHLSEQSVPGKAKALLTDYRTFREGLNEEIINCYNKQFGGFHGYDDIDFSSSVKSMADQLKKITDMEIDVGKKSGEFFWGTQGASRNLIQKDWKPSSNEFTRAISARKVMDLYQLCGYDRQVFVSAIGNSVRKNINQGAYIDNLKRTMVKAEEVEDLKKILASDDMLAEHIKITANKYAEGILDKFDGSITTEAIDELTNVDIMAKRLDFDTSVKDIALPNGLLVSFDEALRDYDLGSILPAKLSRFSGKAAVKAVFGGGDTVDEIIDPLILQIEKELGDAVIRKQITRGKAKRELGAFKDGLDIILSNANSKLKIDTPMRALAAASLNSAYAGYGSNMGFNQIAEMGGSIGYNGLRAAFSISAYLRNIIKKMQSGTCDADFVNDILEFTKSKKMNDAIKHLTGSNSRIFRDTMEDGSRLAGIMDSWHSAIKLSGKGVSLLNFLTKLTESMEDGAREIAIAAVKRWSVDDVDFSRFGDMFTINKMAQIGIDGEDAIKAFRLKCKNYLSKKISADEMITLWKNEDAGSFISYINLLDRHVERSIQGMSVGGTPYITTGGANPIAMRILLQFKDFSLRAVHGQTFRALNEASMRDLDNALAAAYGIGTNSAMYAGVTYMKAWARYGNDDRKREAYLKGALTTERLATAGIVRGAITGSFLGFGNDVIEAATGKHSIRTTVQRPMYSSQGPRDGSDVVGDLIAQTPTIRQGWGLLSLGRMGYDAVMPGHKVTKRTYNDALTILPFNNAIPLLPIFEMIGNQVTK